MDIFIDIRQNADDGRDTQNGWDIDFHPKAMWEAMRNNMEADTPEIYWRHFVFLQFLDHILQELDTRFNAMTGKAVLGLKLLSSNMGKLTGANI